MKQITNNLTLISRVLLALIAVCLCMCLNSCYTAKKALKQVTRAQVNFPEVVRDGCAAWYAPKDSIITNTEYIEGEAVLITDTFVVDCDSVLAANIGKQKEIQRGGVVATRRAHIPQVAGSNPAPATNKVSVPIRQSVRVDTFRKTELKFLENTAQVDAQRDEINSLKSVVIKQRAELIIAANKQKKTGLILAVLIAYILGKLLCRLFIPNISSIVKQLP